MNDSDTNIGLNYPQFLLLEEVLTQERDSCAANDVIRSCAISQILSAINLGTTRNLDENATKVLVETMHDLFTP